MSVENIKNELERIEEDCTYSSKAHFNAASTVSLWNYFFGISSAILSAVCSGLSGITAFKGNVYLSSAASVIAIIAAILTSIMTFCKFADKVAMHKLAGGKYLTLKRNVRICREIDLENKSDYPKARKLLECFSKQENSLNEASLPISEKAYKKAKKGIECGEADYKADESHGV